MKFQFFKDIKNRKIIAVHWYGGKPIKASAVCNPDDTFDEEMGEKLAAARCKKKVARAKKRTAARKFVEAADALERAARRYEKMRQYYMDTVDLEDEADTEIADLLKTL